MVLTKQQQLYSYLSAVFVAALLVGDLTGGKAFGVEFRVFGLHYSQPVSVGLFAFPITFLLTDIVNEFYGTKGARFLTMLGMWMAVFSFVVLNVSQLPRADPNSFFTDAEFNKVFGVGSKLFVASIIAYLCGQFLDIQVFAFWKALTRSRHLWLRATGSTIASQVVDTFVINYLFWYVFPSVGMVRVHASLFMLVESPPPRIISQMPPEESSSIRCSEMLPTAVPPETLHDDPNCE